MTKIEFKFSNGDEVKDLVSGFKGIINCSSIWINGCIRYSVQPAVNKGENKMPDSIWVDEQSIEKISDGVNKKIKPKKTGGPYAVSTGANQ